MLRQRQGRCTARPRCLVREQVMQRGASGTERMSARAARQRLFRTSLVLVLGNKCLSLRIATHASLFAHTLIHRSALTHRAMRVQSLKIMPKNYHVWYLYCETAMQGKPPPECRALFERAIEHAPRSPQLHLMRATLEWKAGNTAAARAFFEAGAQHARGSPLFYGPLFEAWSQFEDAAGEALRASELMAEHLDVCAAEQAQHRSRAGPLGGGDDALDSALLADIDGLLSNAR